MTGLFVQIRHCGGIAVLPKLLLILSLTFYTFKVIIGIGFDVIMMLIRGNLMMFTRSRKEQFSKIMPLFTVLEYLHIKTKNHLRALINDVDTFAIT